MSLFDFWSILKTQMGVELRNEGDVVTFRANYKSSRKIIYNGHRWVSRRNCERNVQEIYYIPHIRLGWEGEGREHDSGRPFALETVLRPLWVPEAEDPTKPYIYANLTHKLATASN